MDECKHEKVDWSPAETEYDAEGVATVWQLGVCMNCKKEVILGFNPAYPPDVVV